MIITLTRVRSRWIGLVLLCVLSASWGLAQAATEVALAGFAYSGSANTIATRFPYSRQYEEEKKNAGQPIGQSLFQALNAVSPSHLKITPQIAELQGRDQALAVALVIGTEMVVVEKLGSLYKLLVLVRGQTMFFDFKSMNVIRSYPVSFSYVDLLNHPPEPDEIMSRVRLVYEGANDKPGIMTRFVNDVAKADIPAHVPRFLQVTAVQVKPEALAQLPEFIKSDPNVAQTWVADMVSEAISTRAGVPIVPYSKGYAIGNVMSMRVADGSVLQLKLPKPDYEIRVELSDFKKIKYNEVAGGATSYVYGAYSSIHIEEPLSATTYLNTALKNGETRVIPASQSYVDDLPHFYDALNGLYTKLARVIDGKGDEKWLKSATNAPNIEQQISKTKELISLCK